MNTVQNSWGTQVKALYTIRGADVSTYYIIFCAKYIMSVFSNKVLYMDGMYRSVYSHVCVIQECGFINTQLCNVIKYTNIVLVL